MGFGRDFPAFLPPASLALAVAVDLAIGELPSRVHPVVGMGTLIGTLKRWALRGTSLRQLAAGAIVTVATIAAFAGFALLTLLLARWHWALHLVVAAFWVTTSFAWRELGAAALQVTTALERGDVAGARRGLRSLCSRDPSALDEEALTAATLESIAENTSDSVVAPLFFLALFGVPGMVAYRAANTLDAMLGYRGELEYAGKASARLDDLLNWIPARLTALLLLISGGLHGLPVAQGWRILWRDARQTASPNAGHPMAAFAGLLGVRLEKAGHYALGDAERSLEPRLIREGLRVVHVACLGAVLCAGAAMILPSLLQGIW